MAYRLKNRWVAVVGACVVAVALAHGAVADDLGQALDVGGNMVVASARSQDRIDELASDTDKLLADYRQVSQQVDSLRVYNKQLEELLAAQEAEKASLNEQIEGVTDVEREITPLMLEMIRLARELHRARHPVPLGRAPGAPG